MALVKTILVFGITALVAVFFVPVCLPAFLLSFLGLKKPMSWFLYRIAQVWARGIVLLIGCDMNVTGQEHIPKRGGVCFVSNHVGIFDIVLALAYIGRPFGFIAKKELLFIPFLNIWIYMLGGLFIDRNNIRKAINTIKLGITKIEKGNAMLIFPEGTRSKGGPVKEFKKGSLRLATKPGVPVIPISISGTHRIFEDNGYIKNGVKVDIKIHPAIETKNMSKSEANNLSSEVERIIKEGLYA